MAATESLARIFAPLYLTVAAMAALSVVGELVGDALAMGFIFLEVAMFGLICLFGCTIAHGHPLRVAVFGIIGAIVGITLDLTIHPTVRGYERNLWPLEIAYHTVVAAICFSVTAVAWKVIFLFLAKRNRHA